MYERLERLSEGMPIPVGGDRVIRVPAALAKAFESGDKLIILQETGDLLHVPASADEVARNSVDRAVRAFARMGTVADDQISEFFDRFADRLDDPSTFGPVAEANRIDVERARARGRSVTRLILSDRMRADMITGLRGWAQRSGGRDEVIETVDHDGWRVDQVRSGLGTVGFVFEGRPNVFADATGVLRSGNTVVFRIGSDALGTARAIVEWALEPALAEAGLPDGAASLVDSADRAAGWALFSDPRLALAVARGSGRAVGQLGAVARQAGTPVSLHGTGGAWIIASASADAERLRAVVRSSLDRKVCNTLNTACVVRTEAERLMPSILEGLREAAGELGTNPKLHVTEEASKFVPEDWWLEADIDRASGKVREPITELIEDDALGREWEWEESPEITVCLSDSVEQAVEWFNLQSPRFVASLVSGDDAEQEAFFRVVDAPFVGDGFTRWVDGQYALDRPELGLSNWQHGRLFARGGVLAGDSVFTIRSRMRQDDPTLHR